MGTVKIGRWLLGRLGTNTSSDFNEIVKNNLVGIKELILDLKELEYVSSAGLRVILLAQKIMENQGRMIITNANESILEIFRITGFNDILDIRETENWSLEELGVVIV